MWVHITLFTIAKYNIKLISNMEDCMIFLQLSTWFSTVFLVCKTSWFVTVPLVCNNSLGFLTVPLVCNKSLGLQNFSWFIIFLFVCWLCSLGFQHISLFSTFYISLSDSPKFAKFICFCAISLCLIQYIILHFSLA